jgi:hypothetical protein
MIVPTATLAIPIRNVRLPVRWEQDPLVLASRLDSVQGSWDKWVARARGTVK